MTTLLQRFFAKPTDPLATHTPTLTTLANNLRAVRTKLLRDRTRAVEYIVDFFDATATAQDALPLDQLLADLTYADRKKGTYTALLGNLHALRVHLDQSGRQPYGMNRTVRGQRVIANDVYLGGVHGVFTKCASYVKGQRSVDSQFYGICNTQAADFMWSHMDMIDLCERIVTMLA